ncbi:hypothetical protein CO172_01420 [Candidatus Uhrbacteria bacterium CG_4_9_14_3_um_filter_36_7]|uniref:Sortilin N-terminal domain-containing protein n=1 Tax=Candidatus Uhrbacteria bacterium CG_4_9_14_3_um_filter_36_7 TaxID=1975033 RepID=A0A2M7XHW2_9BACT|nr:MAG: hypothetical protein CO172_01420 [Candidatus Uhrbacteria bacterium CG_4_9_14_3_um_filter_36_7]
MSSFQRSIFLIPIIFLFLGAGCLPTKQTGRDGGIFKSTDQGKTWNQSALFPSIKGVGNLGGADIETMIMDPSDNLVFYIGTKEDGLFYSYDGANSWQRPRDTNLTSGFIPSVAVDTKNVCTVYVLKNQYVYKTIDCGRSFERIYDEVRSKVVPTKIAVDWYNPSHVYLGLSNGDVLKSTNEGRAWTQILTAKKEIVEIIISHADSRKVLIGTKSEGFFVSLDAGQTWKSLEQDLEPFKNADMVYDVSQNMTGSVMVAATGFGLLRSQDQGQSWEQIKLVTSPGQVIIRSVAIDPKNEKILYYVSGSTFYKTIDAGITWDTRKLPSTRSVSSMIIDTKDSSMIYLGMKLFEEQKKGL